MKTIALATCRVLPELTADEKLLAKSLQALGFDAQPLIWDEPSAPPGDLAAVVIRSCWDYHKKPAEFLAWLKSLETARVKVLNAPPVLRWNLDKSYLRELAGRGITIPPTTWFERGAKVSLPAVLASNNWHKAVLKPTISATAWRTFLVTPENAAELQSEFESLLLDGGAMVQKFVAEVQTRGEWSFVFFDKTFSHAVLKRSRAGDFRVQHDFGGHVEASAIPGPDLVAAAQRVVNAVPMDLTYARVDAVEIAGELSVMELELIEPALFLGNDELAAQRFATAIVGRL